MNMAVWAGLFGIFLCFLADLAQLAKRSLWRTGLFAAGCLLQLTAGGQLLWQSGFWRVFSLGRAIGCTVGVLGFCVLIYVLFFSLPAQTTYTCCETPVVQTGAYGLCRHPGVWCYGICLLGFWLAGRTLALGLAFLLWTAADIVWVFFQDKVVFPRTLTGYAQYQLAVPFLWPRWPRQR